MRSRGHDPSTDAHDRLLGAILRTSLERGFPHRNTLLAQHFEAMRAGPVPADASTPSFVDYGSRIQLTRPGLERCPDPAAAAELGALAEARVALASWARDQAARAPETLDKPVDVAAVAAELGLDSEVFARHVSMLISEAPRASQSDDETGFATTVLLKLPLLWKEPELSSHRLRVQECPNSGEFEVFVDGHPVRRAKRGNVGVEVLRALVELGGREVHVLDLAGLVDGQLSVGEVHVLELAQLREAVCTEVPKAQVPKLSRRERLRWSACVRALDRVAGADRKILVDTLQHRYQRDLAGGHPIQRATARLRCAITRIRKGAEPRLREYLDEALVQGEIWSLANRRGPGAA